MEHVGVTVFGRAVTRYLTSFPLSIAFWQERMESFPPEVSAAQLMITHSL